MSDGQSALLIIMFGMNLSTCIWLTTAILYLIWQFFDQLLSEDED